MDEAMPPEREEHPVPSQKVVVITGASDGIGAAAARQLHRAGHHVVVVGRSPSRTADVARELGAEHFLADFTRLDDVRRLAAELGAAYPRIDVLANNAGGVFGDPTKTVDGFEKTFQINHLAPFLLTTTLLDTLVASGASVIQTSSVGARLAPALDLDDLDMDNRFDAVRAYGAAKLENILFTVELHRRYHAQGISAAAFHPGNVATSFGKDTTSRLMRFITTNTVSRSVFLTTPEKGGARLVRLAEGTPGVDWESGTYDEKGRQARHVNPQARDADLARRLWDRSEELLAASGA
jgi:NAD(P)-dependent dehydrogenase (short-subunit alcohol dehydrogenase family)